MMLIVWLKVILALLVILSIIDPANAEPISTAIGLTALIATTGVSTAIAGAIGGAIVSGAIAVGASLIANALKPQTGDGQPATETGVQTSLRIGADVPRNRIFGKQIIAGQLAYWNVFSNNNEQLQLVFVLGSGPHQLFRMFADGKPVTLGAFEGTAGNPIIEFDYGGAHLAWVHFHNGYADQTIDADLIAGAAPPGRWSASNTGVGVCYARVTLVYWPESFKSGIPNFTFEIGARVYDPRKDGSSGGVGPHRWSDQHTWEFSDNPAVALYNFERGLFINSQRILGRGTAPADMIRAMYVDSANVCDELVTLKDSSTEKRYRIGINCGADRDLKSIEQDICVAMAGSLVEVAGAWGPIAGAAKDVVATITDDDFIVGREIRYSQKKPRDQLVNAMFGSYSDPAQLYQAVPYAPRTSSSDEFADGDRFQVRRDYLQIQSQTQAQRVGEIERRDGRFQGGAGGTLPFKFSYIEAGDWIQWNSVRRNFNKTFRVKSHRLAPDQTIELALDETHADVFDFDAAIDELDPLDPGDLPGIGNLISSVPDFTAEGMQIDGPGTLTIPAIRALWSPILDRTVDDVLVQYRIGLDDTTIKWSPPFQPADGEGIITDGVQAGTGYQARAIITTTPARPVFWTAWVPVVSGANHVVPSAVSSVPIDEITLEMFEEGLKDFVSTQLNEQMERVRGVEQLIASVAGEQEAANWLDKLNSKEADIVVRDQVSALAGENKTWRGDYSATTTYLPNDMVRGPDGKVYYTPTRTVGIAPPFAPWIEQLTAAVVSEQWKSFAGPDGAAAQTSSMIEARFTGVTQPDGTANDLTRSLAQIISDWQAFAGPDYAVAQSEQVTLAQINNNTASITVNSTAVAAIDGRLAATWTVTANVNGYVTGLRSYNDGSTGWFVVVTDYFLVAKPGVAGGDPKPVFSIGPVEGVNTLVLNGNMVADGTITANKIIAGSVQAIHVGTNQIVAHAANIANLVVDNIHIRGAAITVPGFAAGGLSPLPPTISQTLVSVSLTFTGVAGSTVWIQAQSQAVISPAGGTVQVSLRVNGTQINGVDAGGSSTNFLPIMAATTVTATGGSQTVTLTVVATATAGSPTGSGSANLFGVAYLR